MGNEAGGLGCVWLWGVRCGVGNWGNNLGRDSLRSCMDRLCGKVGSCGVLVSGLGLWLDSCGIWVSCVGL